MVDGIAAAEIVFRLGERADVETAVLTGLVCKLLRDFQRRDDGVVFGSAARKNSGDRQSQ